MVREVREGAGDRLAAGQVLGLELLPVGGQNELGLVPSGGWTLPQRCQGLGDLACPAPRPGECTWREARPRRRTCWSRRVLSRRSVVSLLPKACRNSNGNVAGSKGFSASSEMACSISTAFMAPRLAFVASCLAPLGGRRFRSIWSYLLPSLATPKNSGNAQNPGSSRIYRAPGRSATLPATTARRSRTPGRHVLAGTEHDRRFPPLYTVAPAGICVLSWNPERPDGCVAAFGFPSLSQSPVARPSTTEQD